MSAARLRRLGVVAAASALAACAPTVVPPSAPDGAAPAQPGATAWLELARPRDPQLAMRMARVHLDDRPLTALAAGERRRLEVPPGRHRLAVDLWDQPGHCEMVVEIAAGQTLALKVSPRCEALAAATPGALVPDPLLGAAALVAGQAVESTGRRCGGAFRIEIQEAAR